MYDTVCNAHGAYLPDDDTTLQKLFPTIMEPLVLQAVQLKENIELRIGLYTKSNAYGR